MSPEFFTGVDSVPAMLRKRAALTPAAAAYFTEGSEGRWTPTTWSEFHDEVDTLSAELARHGVAPGTRVGILARTCVGWESAQMAALACGAVVVGIDPYYPDALINELLATLYIRNLFVEDAATHRRISASNRDRLTFVALLRGTEAQSPGEYPTLTELRNRRNGTRTRHPLVQATEPAVVAFSSGSTGIPRPILYTHGQVVCACRYILALYPQLSLGTRLVCWLPLANLFQRMINFCAIAKGATSFMVHDPRRVMEVLPVANPEVFVAVPRFCEKLHDGMMHRISEKPLLAKLVERAIMLGAAVRTPRSEAPPVSSVTRILARLTDRFVLARLRAAMGSKIKFIVSGSAPMPRWLLDWFSALGIPVLEAYGVSENLVPVAANRLAERKAGTVGKPVGDNEVRIVSDGEVQVRGSGVFMPNLDENRANARVITEDGFLATGDLGALDEDGFLTLLGRRTDSFKNARGRWVSLTQIEDVLRRVPEIEHAAVVRMPHECLIGILALVHGSGIASSGLESEQQLRATLRPILEHQLATLPTAMRPVAFLLTRTEFAPATGELTTNLKLRRASIADKYAGPLRNLVAELDSSEPQANSELVLRFL